MNNNSNNNVGKLEQCQTTREASTETGPVVETYQASLASVSVAPSANFLKESMKGRQRFNFEGLYARPD